MQPDITTVASLIGEPARARILIALMCGKALTATELALEADVTPQTASSHLAKLVDGQLLIRRSQGRHRYFQLAHRGVAEMIETLLNLSSTTQAVQSQTGPQDQRLRLARVCYDHLAGEIGVALYDGLVSQKIILDHGQTCEISQQGRAFLHQLDKELSTANKRPLCRACLDWSERRNHLAGRLGQWILEDTLRQGWAHRDMDSRAIHFTDSGLKRFAQRYGLAMMSNNLSVA